MALLACLRGNRPKMRVFHGRILRIQGTTSALAPDNGGSLGVDVSRVDEGSYAFLRSGEAVTIAGVVSADGNTVIAETITPDR